VINFEQLQRWDGNLISIVWDSASGVITSDTIILELRRANGTIAYSSPAATQPNRWVATNGVAVVPLLSSEPGEILQGTLSISQRQENSGSGFVPVTNNVFLTFTVVGPAPSPTIGTQPLSRTVAIGTEATFSVVATGIGVTHHWQKNGVAIAGATASTRTLSSAAAADAGSYTVVVSNTGGRVTSSAATLTVSAPVAAPTLATVPLSQSVLHGAAASFAVTAMGTDLRYQWLRNGSVISGATLATLDLPATRLADAGSYAVTISNSAGTTTSTAVALEVAPITRLANLSVRTRVGNGENGNPLTVGITVSGGSPSIEKPLLLHGAGPTLAAFGVLDAAAAVRIALLRGTTVIGSNDGWRGLPAIADAGTSVGAFAFANSGSLDAALLQAVPSAGYSARISSVGAAGVALAEIYDITPAESFVETTPRLTNLSALANVGTGGDLLIAGFSLVGTASKTLLVRAIGPTLGLFGVTGTLADPRLELYLSGAAAPISTNDNWGAATNAAQVATAATQVGAFVLALESRDAVLLVTLPPGTYTAQVSGVNNTIGAALVEVYEVP